MTTPTTPGWTAAHFAMKFPVAGAVAGTALYCFSAFGADDTRMIAITFDDGFKSDLTIALPYLEDDVATTYLNSASFFKNDPNYLATNDIQSFVDARWEIGSHADEHVDLTKSENLTEQIKKAVEFLAPYSSVAGLATPYGMFDDRVVNEALNFHYYHANAWSDAKGLNTRHNIDVRNVHRETITTDTSAYYVCTKVQSLGDNTLYVPLFHEIVQDEVWQDTEEFFYKTPVSKFQEIVDCFREENLKFVTVYEGVTYLEGKNE